MNNTFDLVIIGGGPAGYTAAIKGSLQGFKVAVVERDRVGGACINRGCIPTKALWGTAVTLQRIKDLSEHGITTKGEYEFDFAVAAQRQFNIMNQMVRTIQARMEKLGVRIFRADAKVTGRDAKGKTPFTVSLTKAAAVDSPSASGATASGQGELPTELRSRFILIATGSRPSQSDVLVADHEHVLTTDDIVLRKELPKKLVIVGGGVVACEFASIMNKFGVDVFLLEHSSQVLSAMDQEVVALLMQYMREDGVDIRLHTKVREIVRESTGVTVRVDTNGQEDSIKADCVLLAIGRKPNSDELGLEELGVQTTPRGHIIVDDRLETACKGLFAAGDVVGGQMLAHKAWYDATVAVRAMSGEECRTNYDTVPGAIFTIPEMAAVGMQPDQARQKGINIAIGKFPYAENSQAMCVGKTRGLVKAVIERDTGKVLGCTMVGHDASNLISEVALAMAAGLSANDIANTIHPHPTLSEMIWESFLDTQGLSVHKD